MGQVMDGGAGRVLSTGQLTLMKLWLLQAKYFPLHISLPSSPAPGERPVARAAAGLFAPRPAEAEKYRCIGAGWARRSAFGEQTEASVNVAWS